ncbi:MAG: hypothetical protein WBF90_35840 [Rivularia sp. (in: cyanobacteria)]
MTPHVHYDYFLLFIFLLLKIAGALRLQPITNYQLPITNYPSPITNARCPIPNPQSPMPNPQLRIANC